MYYDLQAKVYVSAEQLKDRGLPHESPEKLAQLGIYRIICEFAPCNEAFEGLEPCGEPQFCADMPYTLCQPMRVVNLLQKFRQARLEQVAAMRWHRQSAGIVVDGIAVATDTDNLARFQGAIQGMEAAGLASTAYKAPDGWHLLELAQMRGLAAAAGRYVQECYRNECRLCREIMAAASIDELNAIDTDAGWPDDGRPQAAEPEAEDTEDTEGADNGD